MYYFSSTPCAAGRGSSIHRAGVFLQFLLQRARLGFFILWMFVSSSPGSLSVYTYVVDALA